MAKVHRSRPRPRTAVLVPSLVFVLALIAGVGWGSWRNLCSDCPSVALIRSWQADQTSKLYSHDGVLIAELGIERRTAVALASLPVHVPGAVLAVEDKRFYRHRGYDVRGLARAALGVVTLRHLGGGSTITQQLARNMFEEEIGFERRLLAGGLTRKLKELQVALELERSYTKDQILEAYLNEVYLGRAYGIEAGARVFFGKGAREMNAAEAALAAAVLNVPGRYDPFRHPERALRRRNLVLGRMAEQGYLLPAEAARWMVEPLPAREPLSPPNETAAPYFVEWVRQILHSRYGDRIYRSGLRVTTTLDVGVQRAAREAMEYGWSRIESAPGFRHPKYSDLDTVARFTGATPYLQGALIALDPRTGGVRALIGGRDFRQSEFDRARQARRQAGSSFKPFVYAAAIASGIPPSHVIVDSPVVLPQAGGRVWRPKNYGGTFDGPMTIREALRRSVNMVAIKLGWDEVGIESVAQTARGMGLSTEIERFPSSTIGAVEVIPIELAAAYATFATLGTRARPFPITRVQSADGRVLWEPNPERVQALDSMVARLMVDLLTDAANRGTGAGVRAEGPDGGGLPGEVPVAGKTGTTNDATDVWFNAFTPNLAATVWFGFDRPKTITPRTTGGLVAAPTWGRFVRRVYYGETPNAAEPEGTDAGTITTRLPIPAPWPIDPRLTTRQVDAVTGRLWTGSCGGEQYTEYYLPGTEPTASCGESPRRLRLPEIRPEQGGTAVRELGR